MTTALGDTLESFVEKTVKSLSSDLYPETF